MTLLVSYTMSSQVYVGDLTLSTQTQVNAFNYTEITGNLVISGNDITNLTPLNSLTAVGGDIDVGYNSSLTSLWGLNGLSSIMGLLYISNNPTLTSLSGLDNLTSVERLAINFNEALTDLSGLDNLISVERLSIHNNASLANLSGLNKLTDVVKALMIGNNNALTSLSDLDNLTTASDIEIMDNDVLYSLSGLENLTSVGGLAVYGNAKLTSLSGLENLTSVGRLYIAHNNALTSLSGLDNITTVMGDIEIWNNSALISLSGLDNIVSVAKSLLIYENYKLTSFCSLYPLLNTGGLSGTFDVHDNALNPTQQEIIDGGSCSSIYNGNLTLSTQAEVNAFNYTEITGFLFISGNDITDLTPLNSLTAVGRLGIGSNPALTSLSGLDNLTFVGDELDISSNPVLTSLSGLDNLTNVGLLWITNNPALTSLSGLNNLTIVGYSFVISKNDALASLAGLDNLTGVGENLEIGNNTSLASFCSLYLLLSSSGLSGAFKVYDNALNPTQQEIIDGGSCINTPPIAICKDIFVSADENCQAFVTAEKINNGSTDPDGDVLSLSVFPEPPYNPGSKTVTLTVEDGMGGMASCEATVTVVDITPPTISATTEPFLLKQNNHKYVGFSIDDFNVVANDNCSVASVFISKVTSDEPEDWSADGSTLNDIVISGDCQTVMVRKERAGKGNGRVYTVELMAIDESGNMATTYVNILVPHNTKAEVINDGAAYEVTSNCNMPYELAKGKSASISFNMEEPILGEKELNVYPNPTSGILRIEGLNLLTNPRIKVFDLTGRCVQIFSNTSTSQELDLTEHPSGLYNIRIYDSNRVSNFKVFKK